VTISIRAPSWTVAYFSTSSPSIFPDDRVATEPGADLEGNVFDCRPRRHVELCSVRKDDRHVGLRIGLASYLFGTGRGA